MNSQYFLVMFLVLVIIGLLLKNTDVGSIEQPNGWCLVWIVYFLTWFLYVGVFTMYMAQHLRWVS